MIVLADADIDRAANAACFGAMMNSGQMCISVERVYVEEPAYEEFLAKLVSAVRGLHQGIDGAGFGMDVGAMTTPAQVAIINEQVEDALASGAKALTGGKQAPGAGNYFEPTVLVDVGPSMKVMQEETFGSVVSVTPVGSEEEALRFANDSQYGLAASVFGAKTRAASVARQVEAGSVGVNDVVFNPLLPNLPFWGLEAVRHRIPVWQNRDHEVLSNAVSRPSSRRWEAGAGMASLHEAAAQTDQSHCAGVLRPRLAPPAWLIAASLVSIRGGYGVLPKTLASGFVLVEHSAGFAEEVECCSARQCPLPESAVGGCGRCSRPPTKP